MGQPALRNEPTSRPARGVVVAAVLITALMVAAVVYATSRTGQRAPAEPAPSATSAAASAPSSATTDADVTASVLAAYAGFREAYIAAAATADAQTAELATFAGDPLLLQTRLALQTQARHGIVYQGRPTWTAKVTGANLTTRPYTATIEDCLDTTGWIPVNRRTRVPATLPGQALRYRVISTAQRYDDGRWLIIQSAADRSRPC